jgi:two-component system, OmpR family, heavy metal sensor histidine kinase CusS
MSSPPRPDDPLREQGAGGAGSAGSAGGAGGAGGAGEEERRAHWSLTRRMALTFAVTTSVIIGFYGLWNGWLLCTALRTETTELIEHETRELLLEVQDSDGSTEVVAELVSDVAEVFVKPACAYVVRDMEGVVVAQAGPPELLRAASTSIAEGAAPGIGQLLRGAPLSTRRLVPRHGLDLELILDIQPTRETLVTFLRSMALSFLVSLVLAAVAGWYTAWRGLAGLRALVSQTRAIDVLSMQRTGSRPRLELDGAPEELHRLGIELDAMLERIEHGLGDMRTFTAGLAHELRSPLQNLIGETEVTLMAPREGDEYRALLRSNLEDLSDLSDAIDNLITWCRTNDPARQKGAHEAFDLAAEARLRLERERRSASRDGVHLVFDATGDTTLVADREAALRVLRNLTANAIAWSPPGSSVVVHIEGLPDRLALRVDDQGPGIPEELGERVFLPFVSGRQLRGRRGGYGLGLAICRAIMDDHGGSLRFEPRAQGGTRFIAEFPRHGDGHPVRGTGLPATFGATAIASATAVAGAPGVSGDADELSARPAAPRLPARS